MSVGWTVKFYVNRRVYASRRPLRGCRDAFVSWVSLLTARNGFIKCMQMVSSCVSRIAWDRDFFLFGLRRQYLRWKIAKIISFLFTVVMSNR